MRIPTYFILSLFWFLEVAMAQNAVAPFLPQSFFFDWNTPGKPVPVPVTAQCESIHITWSRGAATGPNPTAPYYLQIYTSAYVTPFIIGVGDVLSFDWAVPFAPGTLYQICMFDKFGNTGGCQATYSVIPSTSPATCQNVTFPPALGISGIVNNGPMSQFGWIDQCTDVSLTPINGTAPFTLTVAPALHPPYNITVNDVQAINWTVSLTWGSPFFLSVVDSTGAAWVNGPLHSGGGGTTQCLAGDVTTIPAKELNVGIPIGVGIGGLAVGIIAGILSAYFFLTRRFARKAKGNRFVEMRSGSGIFEDGLTQYRPLPTLSTTGGMQITNSSSLTHPLSSSQNYLVEPFPIADEEGRNTDLRAPSSAYSPPARIASFHEAMAPPTTPRPQSHVYVLHHDSNMPPVTIYHQEGTDIVELPPRYPPITSTHSDGLSETTRSSAANDSRSEGNAGSVPLEVHPPRQPTKVSKATRAAKLRSRDTLT